MGRAARARRPPRSVAAHERCAALQARRQSGGEQGARSSVRGVGSLAGQAHGALRRITFRPRLPREPVPLRILSEGNRFPSGVRDRRPAWPPGGRGRGLEPRRRDHHRDRRRILTDSASRRALSRRDPHRGSGRRFQPGIPARRSGARASLDRLHAGAQDHHAASRGDRALLVDRRRGTPGELRTAR
jgi:hypothetical protein